MAKKLTPTAANPTPIATISDGAEIALLDYATSLRDTLQEFVSARTSLYIPSLVDGFNLDEFIRRKGFRTIDQMLLDDQVFAILDLKKSFMLSTGYKFVYSKTGENSELLRFVQYNFESNYEKLLMQDFYQILSAHEYGFSLAEKVFERKTTKDFGDKVFLTRLKFAPPHSIDYFTDSYGDLSRIIQRSGGNYATNDLPVWKMFRYTKHTNFDNPYGQSELSRCYRAWFLKDKIISFWAIYLQKFASPFPVGKVPANFTPDRTNELLGVLESIQQAFAAVIPNDVEIDFLKTGGGSSSEYDSAIERFNQMIGRSLLLPDLIGFSSSTHMGGSEALGKIQFKIFINNLEYERKVLENLFNKQIIKPLIDYNYGPQEVYPELRFLPFQDEDLMKMLDLFLKAVDKGLPITRDDYNVFRKKLDFPELMEDSELLEIKKDEPKEESKGKPAKGKQSDDPESNEDDKKEFSKKKFDFELNREPTVFEERVDFIKEFETLSKKEDDSINELSAVFLKMQTKFIATVSSSKVIDNGDLKAVNKIKLNYLGEVQSKLKDAIKDVYDFGVSEAKKEIKQLKKTQQKEFASQFDDLFVAMEVAQTLAEELIDEQTFASVGAIKNELLDKLKQTMISAIQQGKGTSDVVNDIIEIFNGYVAGAATSALEYSPWLIANIVRTNMTNFYNLARLQVADAPELGGFVEMFQYSAIIDKRTTERCQKLDKFIARKTDPIWKSITPPNHYQCRSMIRYITTVDVQVDKIKPSPSLDLEKLKAMPGGKGFII